MRGAGMSKKPRKDVEAGKQMSPLPGPSKEPKEEEQADGNKHCEPRNEDNVEATGSISFLHVKGPILPEHLAFRNLRQCEYCDFTGTTDDKLIAHREKEHKIFLCRFCKTECPSKFAQHKHLVKCDRLIAIRSKVKEQCAAIQDINHMHPSIKCMHQKILCPICKVTYNNMFELGDHKKHQCKAYAVRLFACSGCKTQFSTANGLKSHLINKYSEKSIICYDTGILSFESVHVPKISRKGSTISYQMDDQMRVSPLLVTAPDLRDCVVAHSLHCLFLASRFQTSMGPMQIDDSSVTLHVIPIKDEPTLPDEFHDEGTKQNLVTAHLLSENDGSKATEYYNAMRKMFFHVNCPYCGIECRTHAALHSHGLVHHPSFERCVYQCGGCELTYQTPTGLAQHLKRQFDKKNDRCYNTVNLVRKQDYLGTVTYWNKKNREDRSAKQREEARFITTDVKLDPDYKYEEIKKEEPFDPRFDIFPGPSLYDQTNFHSLSNFMSGEEEVKQEPIGH